jgi:hypothetical protein
VLHNRSLPSMFTYMLQLVHSLFYPRRPAAMGKNKKSHLTHAEIWDDSALVQSWDDAVEEYEVIHYTLRARDHLLT